MSQDSDSSLTVLPGQEPVTCQKSAMVRWYRSKAESRNQAWLRRRSNECDHRLALHNVCADGSVNEMGDLRSKKYQRRKPKAVSSRQWTDGRRS